MLMSIYKLNNGKAKQDEGHYIYIYMYTYINSLKIMQLLLQGTLKLHRKGDAPLPCLISNLNLNLISYLVSAMGCQIKLANEIKRRQRTKG